MADGGGSGEELEADCHVKGVGGWAGGWRLGAGESRPQTQRPQTQWEKSHDSEEAGARWSVGGRRVRRAGGTGGRGRGPELGSRRRVADRSRAERSAQRSP